MSTTVELDPGRTQLIYEWDATKYCKSLTLENLMESNFQATQRKITVDSFDLIGRERPDVHCYSEMLIQYPRLGESPDRPARVVPDNMVVMSTQPLNVSGSYMLPVHKVIPTLVLEYVSKSNPRKDYEENHWKYEVELKVSYYLVFHPETKDLRVFHLESDGYTLLSQNARGRIEIPELEVELAVHDDWVRFWFRGTLMALPRDLADRAESAEARASTAEARADALEAELAALRDQLNTPK